jgi:hypothetical protein
MHPRSIPTGLWHKVGTLDRYARCKVAANDAIAWLASSSHRRAITAMIVFAAAKFGGTALADADVSAILTLAVTVGAAIWVPAANVESKEDGQ